MSHTVYGQTSTPNYTVYKYSNSCFSMFKTIHVSRSHRIDKVGPNGAIGYHLNRDGSVKVMMKSGHYKDFPFGGFIDGANVVGLPRLKIIYVVALCSDDQAEVIVQTIPRDHYVVGTYLEGKVYVMTYHDSVKHFLRKDADQDGKNNVCSLF